MAFTARNNMKNGQVAVSVVRFLRALQGQRNVAPEPCVNRLIPRQVIYIFAQWIQPGLWQECRWFLHKAIRQLATVLDIGRGVGLSVSGRALTTTCPFATPIQGLSQSARIPITYTCVRDGQLKSSHSPKDKPASFAYQHISGRFLNTSRSFRLVLHVFDVPTQ